MVQRFGICQITVCGNLNCNRAAIWSRNYKKLHCLSLMISGSNKEDIFVYDRKEETDHLIHLLEISSRSL